VTSVDLQVSAERSLGGSQLAQDDGSLITSLYEQALVTAICSVGSDMPVASVHPFSRQRRGIEVPVRDAGGHL